MTYAPEGDYIPDWDPSMRKKEYIVNFKKRHPMDKKIREIEKKIKKDTKGEEKELKSLEKMDKKRDKLVEKGKMKGKC